MRNENDTTQRAAATLGRLHHQRERKIIIIKKVNIVVAFLPFLYFFFEVGKAAFPAFTIGDWRCSKSNFL